MATASRSVRFARWKVSGDPRDYVDQVVRLQNARQCTFMHPLSNVATGLIQAGLALNWLHEHDAITWRMFDNLVQSEDGLYRWPTEPWLPLSYSLLASRPLHDHELTSPPGGGVAC